MNGGSGSPDEVTNITRTEPPEYVKPYSIEMMNLGGDLSKLPYTPYLGERIAPLTNQHLLGMSLTEQRALSGNPAANAAEANAYNTLNDGYMGTGMGLVNQANPWTGGFNPYGGAMNPVFGQANPYMGAQNPYAGQNPYLNSAIDQAQRDVTRNYTDNVVPNLDKLERTTGSFGNSGVREMQQQAMSDYTRDLGELSNNMRMTDYNIQQGIAGADLARNAAMGESWLGRDANLFAQDVARNAGMYNTDIDRNAASWQNQLQNVYDAFNNERTNQLRTMQFTPGMAEADFTDLQKLLGIGDIYRDDVQSRLNQEYDDWMAQQNWPYQQWDVLANAVRTSMGAGGTSITSSPNAYQSNPYASMLGGGMAGYGIADMMGFNPWLGAAGGGVLGSLWG